ncbi:MAG: histidinol-phosphate transaminase [Hungatella sp.]
MKLWEDKIRKVVPYIPGEQPEGNHLIKLNTNENPYPPAPEVYEAWKTMDVDALRKYPDPTSKMLTEALADYYQLEPDQIFVGVGSDDVLGMAFLTFFNSDRPILFPDISYSFYRVWADLYQIPYETPGLDADFRLVLADYQKENGGVVIANPNAPTGILLPLDQVEDILIHNRDVVVIVDEAYIDFGGQSARSLLGRYENLLVVQTFSKSRSMAGIRIGYAMGNPALIRALNDVKYSYNSYTMNLPSLVLGTAAVKADRYFKETIQRIMKTREDAKIRLGTLGFHCLDSDTNFIFASPKNVSAKELFLALREQQIYVRYFDLPRLNRYLRISIGTEEEMAQLYAFLERYLSRQAGGSGWKMENDI